MGNKYRHAMNFNDKAFAERWAEICDEHKKSESAWIAGLRAAGVKAAHPDDGWVDRDANTVTFAYPQFNDGAQAGDLVALGYHFGKTRIVRLNEFKRGLLLSNGRWTFTEPPCTA
jgi:hypothetical protein